MWRTIRAGVLATAIIFVGCDKSSNTASTTPPPPPTLPNAIAPHPTTQQLEHGTWKTLNLKYDPITMNVPESWTLSSINAGADIIIECYTPTDELNIRVPVYHSARNFQKKELIEDARKAAAKVAAFDPSLIKGDVVRDLGNGVSIIENMTLDPSPPYSPATQGTTAPAASAPTSISVQWVFSMCVPDDATHFKVYELRYLGLTLRTFKADQAFLRKIMDSEMYAPNAEPEVK